MDECRTFLKQYLQEGRGSKHSLNSGVKLTEDLGPPT
uniref:Uncharacterized protein n=1 Tax=Anguilla anguilla TaxID=7936 RepID=A0A0E9PU29_ANGAN